MSDKDRHYCVYMHISPSGKKYIGITGQDVIKRWQNGHGYLNKNEDGTFKQPYMARAVLKYPDWNNDWQHLILMDNLTEKEAKEAEVALIQEHKTRDLNYGYNITAGGDGMSGWSQSQETKEKIKAHHKDFYSNPENHPMYGKHHNDETKRKLSNKANERWQKEEERKKASIAAKRRFENISEKEKISKTKIETRAASGFKNPRARCIYCIELHRIFWGAKEAHDEFNIDQSSIAACCRKKYGFKSAGKHPESHEPLHWLYAEDAIRDGYITQEQLNIFCSNLKEDGGINVQQPA